MNEINLGWRWLKLSLSLTDKKYKDPNHGENASITGDLTLLTIWCWGHDPIRYARESAGARPQPHTVFPSTPAFAFPQFRTIWHQLCNSVFMVLIIHERELVGKLLILGAFTRLPNFLMCFHSFVGNCNKYNSKFSL